MNKEQEKILDLILENCGTTVPLLNGHNISFPLYILDDKGIVEMVKLYRKLTENQ